MNTKKLIDSASSCVENMVEGLLYADPNLCRLGGLNVVLRRDIEAVKSRQVTLLSGGGSGHEPAHAGYIGEGMLSGAVLGNVFASPSIPSILAAIRAAAGPKGVILIVKNYTGDRLNFGIALEQARGLGIRARMVVVADDVALPPGQGITGGRGIAGTVFVHKIAGTVAAQGGSLDEVCAAAEQALGVMGSLGVALTTCTLPGSSAASDRLQEPYSCEIGMGIHGEPGRELRNLPSEGAAHMLANALVDALLARLPASSATDCDGPLAVLINNLGALPAMEMATMTKAIVEALLARNQKLIRLYSGAFMTSLDMAGLSITLLRADGLLPLLDFPTTAPAWTTQGGQAVEVDLSQRTLSIPSLEATQPQAQLHSKLTLSESFAHGGMRICSALVDAEPQLTAYDAICGDGDCGLVMKKGATQVREVLASLQQASAVAACQSIADAIAQSMGGTSGALLEIFFRAMAGCLAERGEKIEASRTADREDWVAAMGDGVEAIKRYGGADRGMRTMLDAFLPALEALQQGGDLRAVSEAAQEGAEATKEMQSVAGRANYVVYERLKGTPDPGAVAVAIALATLRD